MVSRPTGVELSTESDKCFEEFQEVFTACMVTRARARAQVEGSSGVPVTFSKLFIPELPAPLSVGKVIEAQKDETTLKKYFSMVLDNQGVEHDYFVRGGMLLRSWLPFAGTDVTGQVMQVVMPEKYHDLVLKATHGENIRTFLCKENV